MHQRQYRAFHREMARARRAYRRRQWRGAFYHLRRAHILGQRRAGAHTLSHWWMLKVGGRRGDAREVAGQSIRLLAALLFSRPWVPEGNTGGSDVSVLRRMPVPPDLRKWMA
ncbi:hypothetical protein A6D6_03788 [Alcanivorax xiamenensis]|uniref:DUF3703 domain-containing protein n=1 Tax=Alcanivorax xiamenensis TaxID=1177156 RepID=A0ABQ6Y445_9GAMM|nr:DUF3703 domain-containing protein [Alcanivorax xiamenensis]KAF0803207.1 hypothetical protein A6D6_03788 [Alcanivorax xiamenensis]